jgi:hypothetical protein
MNGDSESALGDKKENECRSVCAEQVKPSVKSERMIAPKVEEKAEAKEKRYKVFHAMCAKSPNDPKLSDRRSGRGTCRWAERWWWSAAGAVTAEPVRCSAWLAVAVEWQSIQLGVMENSVHA